MAYTANLCRLAILENVNPIKPLILPCFWAEKLIGCDTVIVL